ncbi:hypothetical protein [Symbioplanes lichenis]|uniref:hypothetical protein n=1 Tax=Symbioplanes lichenis TaxID=1629072 RepID=UPI00273868CB|nr:hypothetical protein [Actinoplanes lichenis]
MPLNRMSSPRRLAGLLVTSAALVLSVAACGGGSDDATGGGDNGNGPGGTSAFAAYTSCLQENGVTITMPSGGARVRPSGAPSGGPQGGFPSGGPQGGFPSGQPRPSGSAGPGGGGPGGGNRGGGFPGGGMMQKPDNVDQDTWDKAQAACASVRPSFGAGRNGNGGGRNGANAAYTNCLKDHGVTLTDGRQPDTSDAKVKAAVDTCKALAPAPSASATS